MKPAILFYPPAQSGQPIDLLYAWGDRDEVGAAFDWLDAQPDLTYTGATMDVYLWDSDGINPIRPIVIEPD
jgi:hypothetical protein